MRHESYFIALCFVLGLAWLAIKLYGWIAVWGLIFAGLSLVAAIGLGWHIVEDLTEDKKDAKL